MTLPFRFPFQKKLGRFSLIPKFIPLKNDLAYCWKGKRYGSVASPSAKVLHASSLKRFSQYASPMMTTNMLHISHLHFEMNVSYIA